MKFTPEDFGFIYNSNPQGIYDRPITPRQAADIANAKLKEWLDESRKIMELFEKKNLLELEMEANDSSFKCIS